ncbi:hypothetical protein [Agromyces sp. Marseille-Q5079]|uniref:hypothetical protein n=1 Tax=Agromyces sp. Marseille-Q5079 TaxID=3439059 RepID=UPI003D9C7DE1
MLSLEEGFRTAYFMTEQYIALESNPDDGLILFQGSLDSDPARWSDWRKAVTRRALADPAAASEYLHDFRFRFAAPGEGGSASDPL